MKRFLCILMSGALFMSVAPFSVYAESVSEDSIEEECCIESEETRLCISQEDFDKTTEAMKSTSATTRKNAIIALFKAYGNGMTGAAFYLKYFGSSAVVTAANNVYQNGLGTYCYVEGAVEEPVHVHTWVPADCEYYGYCSECGERNLVDGTQAFPLGHKLYKKGDNWVCSECGKVYTPEDIKSYESPMMHQNTFGEEASDYHMMVVQIPWADFYDENGIILYDINNEPASFLVREELHEYVLDSDGVERCKCGSMRAHEHSYTEYKGYEDPDQWNIVPNIISICDKDGCGSANILPNDYSNGISEVTGPIDIVGMYDHYKKIYEQKNENFNVCLATWVEQYGFDSISQLEEYVADLKNGVEPYVGTPENSSATRFWDWFYSIDYVEDPSMIHGSVEHKDHFDVKEIRLKEVK